MSLKLEDHVCVLKENNRTKQAEQYAPILYGSSKTDVFIILDFVTMSRQVGIDIKLVPNFCFSSYLT